MIEINPISTAPKDGTIVRGVFLSGEHHDNGVQMDCYWSERYGKWNWRNSASFCRNEPDGWLPVDVTVFK